MATIHGPLGTMLVMLIVAPALCRAADTLDVVATTADLAAVARAVGGDAVDVTALARPTERYALRRRQAQQPLRAGIIDRRQLLVVSTRIPSRRSCRPQVLGRTVKELR